MNSNKLRRIFGLSIPVFVIHGLEEYFHEFYNIDSHVEFVLMGFGSYQIAFLIFQLVFWLSLVLASIFFQRLPRAVIVLIGLVYIYELSHLIKAIEVGGYYPGLISASVLYIAAFFYLKELAKNRSLINSRK